jgi:hypothetical protein
LESMVKIVPVIRPLAAWLRVARQRKPKTSAQMPRRLVHGKRERIKEPEHRITMD